MFKKIKEKIAATTSDGIKEGIKSYLPLVAVALPVAVIFVAALMGNAKKPAIPNTSPITIIINNGGKK